MTRIILLGYMGAGKTTIGKALAKELGLMFFDLDWYIENRFCKKVPQIFATEGEEAFRRKERNMLHEVAEFEDVVISLGGGAPCFFDNMDYINQQGETIYLKGTPDILYQHLLMAKGKRPLLEGKSKQELMEYIETSLAQRESFYSKAKYTFDIELLSDPGKTNECINNIRKLIDK